MSYKQKVFEYVQENFSNDSELYPLACCAVDELRKDQKKSWKWIDLALRKKSVSEWRKFRFGLLFNNRYQACIDRDIAMYERQKNYDVRKWEIEMTTDENHKTIDQTLQKGSASPTKDADFVF